MVACVDDLGCRGGARAGEQSLATDLGGLVNLKWPHRDGSRPVVGGPVAGVVDPASTRGGDADPGPAVLRADG